MGEQTGCKQVAVTNFFLFKFQHLIERESGKVILYLTTLGVIRETFNRCVKVRQILRTMLIKVEERDVFMSKDNQQDLSQRMGNKGPALPQIFVDGQYLGVRLQINFSNIFFKWSFPASFSFIFVFSIQLTVKCSINILPMTGFEQWTSKIGSNHSINWATTTSQLLYIFLSAAKGQRPTTLRWNNTLWLVKNSHETCNVQSVGSCSGSPDSFFLFCWLAISRCISTTPHPMNRTKGVVYFLFFTLW